MNTNRPTAPNKVDLWRVHYVHGDATGSQGQVELIEGRQRLEDWLLEALLEAEGRGIRKSGHRQERRWSAVLWWRHKYQDDDEERPHWGIIEVLAVWHMVDDKWIEYKFELVSPFVHLATIPEEGEEGAIQE